MKPNTEYRRSRPVHPSPVHGTGAVSQPEFPASAELGCYLMRRVHEQIEIDRCEAERLSRLRAIQDRD